MLQQFITSVADPDQPDPQILGLLDPDPDPLVIGMDPGSTPKMSWLCNTVQNSVSL
jgi:hypothetical protein